MEDDDGGGEHLYKLMPMSAPMVDAATGDVCLEVVVEAGKMYTLGRSRSGCDVLFRDRRVSRKHCQVYLHSCGKLLLLDAGVELEVVSQRLLLGGAGSCDRMGEEACKPCLNGIFVNGARLASGGFTILSAGSVVSLVAPTAGGQVVMDDDFGPAIGFTVAVDGGGRVCKRRKQDVEESMSEGCSQDMWKCDKEVLKDVAERRQEHKGFGNVNAAHFCACTDDVMMQLDGSENWKQPLLLGGAFLNRLRGVDETSGCKTVSLSELLAPLDELVGIFAATFCGDVKWFLSSNNISTNLPVTVACHDSERSWSIAKMDRSSNPFPEWPNVTVVYPPFPNVCAFGQKELTNRRGIGCHHPKFFLLLKKASVRVIVTSANLRSSQWVDVTNNIWWQDFPALQARRYENLFFSRAAPRPTAKHSNTFGDFSSQLAAFVSSLLVDVPSQAHWVTNLADYDFSSAEVTLIASVPGLHGSPYEPLPPCLKEVPDQIKKFSIEQALGVVDTMIVGISYRFGPNSDPKGTRLRKLAQIIGKQQTIEERGMIPVCLKRLTTIAADPNAVGIFVLGEPEASNPLLLLHKDQTEKDISGTLSQNDCMQLGFLPRDTAKWVAHLCDRGICTFAACVTPKEVLAAACGQINDHARLALHVFRGAQFSQLLNQEQSGELDVALCGLLRSLQRPLGLWRLEQVLSKYNWPNSEETDFLYGSSSVGSSLDGKFLAAFASASGRRASPLGNSDSAESDPQWGCWTVEHEKNKPSIRIVFPTIQRAKEARGGILSHCGLHHFPERTWEQLKPADMLQDAVPVVAEREGFPMHSKVAIRRFQHEKSEMAFGWIYCGSHNFSPAAWGRPLFKPLQNCKSSPFANTHVLGCTLFISNYELGVMFIVPPHVRSPADSLDRFQLPFVLPAPKYEPTEKPATDKELYVAASLIRCLLDKAVPVGDEEPTLPDEEAPEDIELDLELEPDMVKAWEPTEDLSCVESLWTGADSVTDFC